MSDQVNDATIDEFDPFEGLTFDSKPVEFPPYLGIIVRDERGTSAFNDTINHQWIYAVRPVDVQIGGKTGAWTGFIKVSTKQNTMMMRLLPNFAAIFGKKDENGVSYAPGSGQLLGQVAWFQNKSFDFGPKMSPSKLVPVPVKKATEEEIERARALPAYVPQASADEASNTSTPSTNYTEEQVQAAVDLYNGKTHKEVVKEAVKPEFDSNLKAGIQSGGLLNEIQQRGLVEKDENGVFHALVTA